MSDVATLLEKIESVSRSRTASGDALIVPIEKLREVLEAERAECEECDGGHLTKLIDRQAALLTAAVNALKGEPPKNTLWSHHDVAELATAMRARAETAEWMCGLKGSDR